MSNKPRIYGYCPAGCKWETVHRDEFERSASIVACNKTEGDSFSLEPRKTYRIKKKVDLPSYKCGFSVSVCYTPTNSVEVWQGLILADRDVTVPADQADNPVDCLLKGHDYKDYFDIRLNDVSQSVRYDSDSGEWYSVIQAVVDYYGKTYTFVLTNADKQVEISSYRLIVQYADECYIVNEFAEVKAKDGESVTIVSIQESNTNGSSNVVTFSDGNTLSIKNGDSSTVVVSCTYDATEGRGRADYTVDDIRTFVESDYAVFALYNGRAFMFRSFDSIDMKAIFAYVEVGEQGEITTYYLAIDKYEEVTLYHSEAIIEDARFDVALSLESDHATIIPDGTDFDTLTEPGNYKVRTWSSGCTMKNSPNKNSGRLTVMYTSDHDRVLQVYVANTTDALVYVRIKDGEWREWASIVTSEVTDEISKKIGRSLSLSSDDAYVIADGTDFNDITEPRTYKVRTWSSGTTMKNSPNKNAGRLIVMQTSQQEKLIQIYVANTTDALMYVRIKDGEWREWASVVTSEVTDKLRSDIDSDRTFPVKLRVMQYNIGKFNMGFGHDDPRVTSEEVVAKIANYKRFFGEYQPNILGIQEFTDYIDCTDNTYPTNGTLFDEVFPYSTSTYYGNILKSDIVPYVTQNIILDEGEDHSQPAVKAKYLINGKVLGVIVGAGDWRDECSAHRKAQLADAMARLSECDHAIICLDWNVKSQEEFDDLVGDAEDSGYKVANGGYFGKFETYGNDNCYRSIDQILCKGAKIKNVVKPDVYKDLASDHYPLIADIILI